MSKEAKIMKIILSFVMLVMLSGAALAQSQNPRANQLERREQRIERRQERVEKRNPQGYGRRDDRLERRENRVDRKQARTEKRINRRKTAREGL